MPRRQGWLNGWIRVAGLAAVAAGMISGTSRTSSGDGPAASARRFDMRLQSSLKLQKAGADGVKTLEATTRVVYDRTERPGALDIAIHAMEIELREDGRKTFDTTMTHAAITTHRGEATDEEFYETPKGKPATVPAIRRML